MQNQDLIPHLFRTEYRKIISVLGKHFGFDRMEVAEDIASETFLSASQTWGLSGVPENPTAWLYHVAKNKAKNYLKHEHVFATKVAPDISASGNDAYDIDLSPQNINDSQLQMMFAVCHPSIPIEAQIGLSLRILCGFGIEEIADAFLTNKETINKRLLRAKDKLRSLAVSFEVPGVHEISARIDSVLRTIYLLFNEGYYSISQHVTLRRDLCLEAMRLCFMLVENKFTNTAEVNALMSLMCFHASRFDARIGHDGTLVLYEDQDTSLWNTDLIAKGGYFLNCSASGTHVSRYHLEAGIAYWNTQREDTMEKWENILQLYNRLLQTEYSPMAALNRTYALSKANGKSEAIVEAEKLNLTDSHFYFALLGELYSDVDDNKAKLNFEKAIALAKTTADRKALERKLSRIA